MPQTPAEVTGGPSSGQIPTMRGGTPLPVAALVHPPMKKKLRTTAQRREYGLRQLRR